MSKEIDVFHVNGLRIANIFNDSPISFFGIFCLNGYIFEKPEEYGVAHFGEHMFFKGTKNRTWKQINMDFAKIGSTANAYTSSDEVCYFVTTMNDQMETSAAILMDMFFNSNYDQAEVDKERHVIVEEKKMYDDDPSYDFSTKCSAFLNPSFGHDALGSMANIEGMTREKIVAYLNSTLNPENVMMVFCGNVPSDSIKLMMEKLIQFDHPLFQRKIRNENSSPLWSPDYDSKDKIKILYEREKIEQAQVTGVMNGLSSFDALKPDEIVLLSCLGGGDYSMMYERLRENLGLCYALGVGNDTLCYPHLSVTKIFGMTDDGDVYRFIHETEKIFKDIKTNGLDKDLFECAKNSVASAVMRSIETSRGKASFLAKRVFFGKPVTTQEYVKGIKATTLKNCNDLAQVLLDEDKVKWAAMVKNKSAMGA